MARMSLRAACDQARQWLESNSLEQAIGLCEHILQAYPGNLEAYRMLGEAHLANRQYEKAQHAFERVLRADPENIPAHVGLGIAFERLGRIDRAVRAFELAHEIKPDMPELRSQLLRLYSDGGIENPQLRLNRAGLARLYAKGQMLPQAIAEFRQVIADQPDRYDAKVALAETLWRDEQEQDAAALCRKLIAERSELLKANLLLGYIELGSGRAAGEQYWRAAAAADPDLTVARALFEPLPGVTLEAPMLDEWDEQLWKRQREEQEVIAATRPMQAAPARQPEPEPEPEFVPGASFFASRAAPVAAVAASSDDFLASLLDLGGSSTPVAAPPIPAPTPVPAATPADLGIEGMQPLSLSDLGLSDAEVADLEGSGGDERPTPTGNRGAALPPTDIDDDFGLGDLTAFSLDTPAPSAPSPTPSDTTTARMDLDDDFGLGDLPAFSLDTPAPSTPSRPAAPPVDDDFGLGDLQGFSLDSFDNPVPPPSASRPAPGLVDDDLGLGGMQPFSLNDLGLSDDEIAGLESIDSGLNTPTRQTPPASNRPAARDLGDLPTDLQPFSIDELEQSGGRGFDDLPSSLQPFSLDDTPPASRSASRAEPQSFEESGSSDQRGYSWQQPSAKPATGFSSPTEPVATPTEESLFDKLRQRRQSAPLPPIDDVPEVTLQDNEDLGLFSIDDIPLRDEPASTVPPPQIAGIARREGTSIALPGDAPVVPPTPTAPPTPPSPPVDLDVDLSTALASGQIKPFSFDDLGLSDEELAQLGLGTSATTPAVPAATSADDGEMTGTIADDIEPFTLDDLGLSNEELAALGLGDAPARTIPTSPAEPEPIADLPITPVTPPEPEPEPTAAFVVSDEPEYNVETDLQTALETGEVKPFSFADLGLSEEELALLGLGEATPVPAAEPEPTTVEPESVVPVVEPDSEPIIPPTTPVEAEPEYDLDTDLQSALAAGEVKPFSFADLGLSEEELALLGLGEATPAPTAEPEPALPVVEPEPEPTPEPIVPEERPYYPVVDEPEYNVETDLQTALETGEVKPFSFADLGLSEEELALLGLGEATPAAAPVVPAPAEVAPVAPEPVTADDDPLGLDLGLDLGFDLDQPIPPAAPPAAPTLDLGDDVAPFSLEGLGFSDEELGTLDAVAPVASDDGLGLTAEELEGLDVGGDLNLEGLPTAPITAGANDVITGDPIADRLIILGRQQGYIDIADIIDAVEDPESEADRIDVIGRLLHEHDIEIRDGDEVIDLDAEYADDEEFAYEAETPEAIVPPTPALSTSSTDEVDMTPFSLSDLGLSDDEIAMFSSGDISAETTPPANTVDDTLPFSFDGLDLEAPEPSTPTTPVPDTTTDLMPFSLNELGIADEPIPPTPPTTSLRGAEIGSLDLLDPEPIVSPPPVAPVAPVAPVTPIVSAPPTPPTPPVRPAAPVSAGSTGNSLLDQYLQRVEQEPENHPLRLSVARASMRLEHVNIAMRQYKQLIRRSSLLDDVVDDLYDIIAESDDDALLRQAHRTLGDALSKQGLLDQAMQIYAWTPGMPKVVR